MRIPARLRHKAGHSSSLPTSVCIAPSRTLKYNWMSVTGENEAEWIK